LESSSDNDDSLNHCSSSLKKVVKSGKYAKKSDKQVQLMLSEFEKNPNWSKSDVERISKMTKMSFSIVYKWCWDQRKLMKQTLFGLSIEEGFLS
jgi:hypothetical protein